MADDDESQSASEPMMINCDVHGSCVSAIVCRHMLGPAWRKVGFVENKDDPNDQQAWCDKCEQMYVAEGMSERFIAFNNFAVVCVGCYQTIKTRHSG